MTQTLLDEQHQANENQARLQEQMAKKDEDHARETAQVQKQLLEVLERRPERALAQPPGTQIVFNTRGNDPNDLYEWFRNRGPKEFTGHEDPLVANDWLEHTENILEIFKGMGKQQVELTASMFTGLVDIWWKIVKAEYRTMADAHAWDNFKKQFGDKYVPAHVKKQKAIEFQQLLQGNMTVLEYLTKFERLSRYAPDMIDTVEKKIGKFLEGLNPIIERDATGVVPPATFEAAVRRAYKFENLNNKIL